jgi:hypothetical protein
MRAMKIVALTACLLCCGSAFAQQPAITILDSGHKVSLRGLSVVSDDVLWASGSNGTVARSTDGGKTFEWLTVPGYEKRDFRDIEAFDENTAVIMGIDAPAVILKTKDGGKSWAEVFRDTTKGMFLDAMTFKGKKGVVVGDPINDYVFVAYTKDGGEHWKKIPAANAVKVDKDEAFFASSGTNVIIVSGTTASTNQLLLVSGGSRSRLITDDGFNEMPIMQGGTSKGANSVDVFRNKAVVVGGDFAHDTISHDNCVIFDVSGKSITYTIPKVPPHGYRSCVTFMSKKKLITCGTSGVDISNNTGKNWSLISTIGFHVCQKAKRGKAVFLAGGNGRIAKLEYR